MTKQDYFECARFVQQPIENGLINCNNNLLLSPCYEQIVIFESIFNKPKIFSIDDWNLLQPHANKYDIIFAANVLMYIDAPKIAIANILDCCRYFIFQDVTIRRRNGNTDGHELGGDGDCMRFYYNQTKANYENACDLSYLGDKIKYFKEYKDNEVNTHFITLIKGYL
jgi:hypothetical protein